MSTHIHYEKDIIKEAGTAKTDLKKEEINAGFKAGAEIRSNEIKKMALEKTAGANLNTSNYSIFLLQLFAYAFVPIFRRGHR